MQLYGIAMRLLLDLRQLMNRASLLMGVSSRWSEAEFVLDAMVKVDADYAEAQLVQQLFYRVQKPCYRNQYIPPPSSNSHSKYTTPNI